MKITICGSMRFAEKMINIKKELEGLGHEAIIPNQSEVFINNGDLKNDFKFISEGGFMQDHFDKVKNSDAILVINEDKNGTKNYIGGSTLMEIGIAYNYNKKIFLLNDIPNEKDINYAFEVKIVEPIIIYGDLSKISSSPPCPSEAFGVGGGGE